MTKILYLPFLHTCILLTFPDDSQCVDCPVGHYCPYGTEAEPRISPIPCDPGTYNPDERTGHPINCRRCDAGWACPQIGQHNVTDSCIAGTDFLY